VKSTWLGGKVAKIRNVKDTARGKEGTACAGGTCLGTAARANMLYGVIMAVSDQRSATSSPKLVMLACDDFRQPTDLTSEGIEDVSWFITVHRYGPYVWKGRGHRGDAYISMADRSDLLGRPALPRRSYNARL
jgi:hypothetical protein